MRRSAKPLYFADMKRVLASRPKGVTGLAVAGMPVGAPGMEMPGRRGQPYDVVAFARQAAGRSRTMADAWTQASASRRRRLGIQRSV